MAGIRGCGRYLQQSHHAANGYCEETDGGKLLLEASYCWRVARVMGGDK